MGGLKENHIELFHSSDLEVWAPGRINLIGEHTDYNSGFVLPAAIDRGIQMFFSFDKSANRFDLYSHNFQDSRHFTKSDHNLPDDNWAKYLQALIQVVEESEKIEIPYFSVSLESNIPVGGGLSSSAALNAGFLTGINQLLGKNWSKVAMAELAQKTEHKIGLNVGIMDPYAIIHGVEDGFIFLDCQSQSHEIISSNFDDYVLVLVDTMVSHNLASSEYNARRETCERVVAATQTFRKVTSLRDVNKEDLQYINHHYPEVSTVEAEYILEENQRVVEAVTALKSKDFLGLGKLLFASHEGLKSKYRVSCDELDFLVDIAIQSPAVLGARMMGGGFGGNTINLLHKNDVQQWEEEVKDKYKVKYGVLPNTLVARPSIGAKIVE
ncbi:galactokinase [Membranihabitans marinus]|uniref:galactokinase n=1 Tax=Membranihabitans marinus TaxID=1227546 RepID=UPI001EFFE530|nr:galactokinase [Membranihabitans marinus]